MPMVFDGHRPDAHRPDGDHPDTSARSLSRFIASPRSIVAGATIASITINIGASHDVVKRDADRWCC
jgi:hypothetical protein